MEIMGIIALLVIVGFLIRILGRAVMNIGISLGVIILVIAVLTGLSAMGFF